ncbi:ligase-associated DNA damage response endonuclease PdeM [Agaribacter flavus]|uniref:Ligase-associated DNA damage response endonuclease PdeM n=1 Tax=Agaribacter flavus TaxID=1902781 RepID=A0ABV7FSF1_9ALTE
MIDAKELELKIKQNKAIPVKFCGQHLILDSDGIIFWPACNTLIISDLHLEKGSFLNQFGNTLPTIDTHDTLVRMQVAIERYKPACVICLGDSFHDRNAVKRMHENDLNFLNSTISGLKKWIWILGNHDPVIPDNILGLRMKRTTLFSIELCHEPSDICIPKSHEGQIFGHFHPKISTYISRQKFTGKSFLLDKNLLLMPAFGSYTGGLSVDDKAIATLFCKQSTKTYLLYDKKLIML